jgi:type II secretory pathway pseudopilin PulG
MRRRRRAYTIIEMLTTVAALIIVLGLMVQLARYVRNRSADTLTRDVLLRMNGLMAQYHQVHPRLAREVPQLVPTVAAATAAADEPVLMARAVENSRAVVRIWREETGDLAFKGLALSTYDTIVLRDAWGTPIVYMPPAARNVGLASQGRDFYMSAGPDRKFGTLLDNLYSYERSLKR